MSKLPEVALTVSPEGWKALRRMRGLREHTVLVLGISDCTLERDGWQLWHWFELNKEDVAFLGNLVAEVRRSEFRFVVIDREAGNSEEYGDASGPFDLMLFSKKSGCSEDWIHIDEDYANIFFEQIERSRRMKGEDCCSKVA